MGDYSGNGSSAYSHLQPPGVGPSSFSPAPSTRTVSPAREQATTSDTAFLLKNSYESESGFGIQADDAVSVHANRSSSNASQTRSQNVTAETQCKYCLSIAVRPAVRSFLFPSQQIPYLSF